MQIESYKEAAKFLNERFATASLKEFLFGTDSVSHRHIKGIGAIYKILKADFILIYLSFLRLSRTEIYSQKSRYFRNVAEALGRLYHDHSFGLDIVIYVLAEAQKDVIANGERSFFAPYLSSEVCFEYGKIYTLIDKWTSANHNDIPIETILSHFVSVVELSRGLCSCEVKPVTEDGKTLVYFVFDELELSAKNLIHADENGYAILVRQTHYTDKLVNDYVTLDNTDHIYVYH